MSVDLPPADVYAAELDQVRAQLDHAHAQLAELDELLDAANHTHGIQR